MMKKNTHHTTLPQMQFACANDELRPSMNYVFMNKNKIAASDGNILVVHNTEDFFDSNFIENLPENNILIHRLDWAEMAKKSMFRIFDTEKKLIIVKRGDRTLYFEYKIEGGLLKYPNWESVWPNDIELESVDSIGINLKLLTNLQKALNIGLGGVKFSFHGKTKAIVISRKDYNSMALIMPCIVD